MPKVTCQKCGGGFSCNKEYTKHLKNNFPCKQRKVVKPFLKWLGGKTQIINTIMNKFPKKMDNYHELFLGGGSVLLALLSLKKANQIRIKGKIYAYDINEILINVYKHVQNNKEELYSHIKKFIEMYDSLNGTEINRKPKTIEEAHTSKESYYYWTRDKFNKMKENTVERSALFMCLNKTCFRGVYREGPNGFNVPYGHYKKTPTIITKDELNGISDLIKDVEFIQSDFASSIEKVKEGDFVYLDPPYAPEEAKSFVGYTKDGFSLEKHMTLFREIKKLDTIKFVMSNAKVDLVMNNFEDYNHEDIVARRAINSKKPQSKTTEVIIYN
jgi:DNA adenine methylase